MSLLSALILTDQSNGKVAQLRNGMTESEKALVSFKEMIDELLS